MNLFISMVKGTTYVVLTLSSQKTINFDKK